MPLLTLREAAQRLDITPDRIQAWGDKGFIPLHLSPDASEPLVDEADLLCLARSLGFLYLTPPAQK